MRNRVNISDVCSASSILSKRAALFFCLLAVIFTNAGCIKKAAALTSGGLAINFTAAPPGSLQTSGQATLVATVTNDTANLGVDWNVSCSSPKCGSFNPVHTMNGEATVYMAPSSLPANGMVNVTAMATSNHAISQTVIITITNSVSIAFTQAPPATLQANSSVQVVAQITGDSTGAGVAWLLTCIGSSNCGSIGPTPTLSGSATTFTAPSAPGVMVTIIAQSVASPSAEATSIVSITAAAGPSISFNQAPPSSLFTNGVSFITASVINDLSNAGIDWSLTCAGPGSCGSLSATHSATDLNATISYTAPAAPPGGNNQVTITAAATVAPNPSVSASITISIPVISVSISGAPSQLPVNTHTSLSATVTNDTANRGVSWSVTCTGGNCGTFNLSPPNTLSGAPIVYTAPNTVPPGNTVTITATSVADGTKSASTSPVTITPAGSISIAFATGQPTSTMLSGAAQNITANVTGDTTNAGADWTVTCTNSESAGSCGTFNLSPAHTVSGSPIGYTAPSAIPSGGLTVTITAASTFSPTTTISAPILVTVATTGVTLSTVPTTISEDATQSITATLTNDPGHGGVNWTATCTQGTGTACGTFNPSNPTTTLSGDPTAYTAPATAGTVTITATSVDSPGIFASTGPITIQPSAFDGLLSGRYALSVTGTNASGQYAILGSIDADGQGNITSGEEDYECPQFSCPIIIPSLTGSTYTVGADGRGTMSLHTGFVLGIQAFHFVIVNAASGTTGSALIIDTDSGANASGSLDLQTSADFTESAIAGSYAFTFSGLDYNSGGSTDFGGTFTVSGANFTGKMDTNDQGGTGGGTGPTVVQNSTFSGALSSPDSSGRGTFTQTGNGNTYVYYVVSSGFLKFLEEDGNFLAAGSAFTQGGSFSSGTTYAFTAGGESGLGNDPNNPLSANPFVMGGLLSPGSGTTLNGVVDVNISTVSPLVSDTTFAGTFSAPSSGRGTLTFPAGTTGGTGNSPGPSVFAYYPTASHGILMMNLDPPAGSSPGYTAIGTAFAQVQGAAFSGNYAMNFSEPAISDTEDVVGQVIPTPTNNPPTLAGTVDENNGGTLTTGLSLVGSFTANSTGRLPGSFTIGTDPTQTEVFYVVNANTVLCIEMDANDQTAGILEIQNLQ